MVLDIIDAVIASVDPTSRDHVSPRQKALDPGVCQSHRRTASDQAEAMKFLYVLPKSKPTEIAAGHAERWAPVPTCCCGALESLWLCYQARSRS